MNNIIEQLGFKGNLLDMNDIIMKYPNYSDITSLGADQCYFISGHSAAIFSNTKELDNTVMVNKQKLKYKINKE